MKSIVIEKYLDLSVNNKNEITHNFKTLSEIEVGFYSKAFSIIICGKSKKYRFHSIIENGIKKTKIIFNKKDAEHQAKRENNHILFYDNALKRSLKIDFNLFGKEIEKQINFNLSTEQLEMLADGKDVFLEVINSNNKDGINKFSSIVKNNEIKNFVADYSFFLGKINLLLKDFVKEKKTGLSLTK